MEVSRDDVSLLAAAVYRPDSDDSLSMSGRPKSSSLNRFDRLASNAQFLLGHNIIAFDIPHLRALNPNLRLLKLPVVDTLRLNPLAFPRRPYHHLVKHYKDGGLVRRQINNPLLDSKLAVEAFANQLKQLEDAPPELLTAWHWFRWPRWSLFNARLEKPDWITYLVLRHGTNVVFTLALV